jgi:hypothetical protein
MHDVGGEPSQEAGLQRARVGDLQRGIFEFDLELSHVDSLSVKASSPT